MATELRLVLRGGSAEMEVGGRMVERGEFAEEDTTERWWMKAEEEREEGEGFRVADLGKKNSLEFSILTPQVFFLTILSIC